MPLLEVLGFDAGGFLCVGVTVPTNSEEGFDSVLVASAVLCCSAHMHTSCSWRKGSGVFALLVDARWSESEDSWKLVLGCKVERSSAEAKISCVGRYSMGLVCLSSVVSSASKLHFRWTF